MANDFLTSSVIPGSKIEHHEHRRLITVLAIVIVIGILGMLGYRWNSSRILDTRNNQQAQISSQEAAEKSRVATQLQKAIVPVTTSEKEAIGKQLQKAIVPVTQSEKEAAALRLLKAIEK